MKRTRWLVLAINLMLGASSSAGNAQIPAGDADLPDQARNLYEQGATAASKKLWSDAHAAFLAAWEIKAHYLIALDLAVAEVRLGKHRDAAEHAAFYLREAPADQKSQRTRAQDLLNEARKKIATVNWVVDVDGADLKLDRQPFGKSPAQNPLFLTPGPHSFEAEIGRERHAYSVLILNPGDDETVSLTIPSGEPTPETATPESGVVPDKIQTDVPVVPSGNDIEVRAGSFVPYQSVITGGFSLAALATAAGVVMTVVANSRSQSAASVKADVERDYGATGCDTAAQPDWCAQLDELLVDRAGFTTGAVWSFVGAGALVIGTTIYTFVMPSNENAALGAIPVATPQGGAIVLTGVW